MLPVVNGFGQGRVQGWVDAGGCISHGTAESQVGGSLLSRIRAVDAHRAEEDVHHLLRSLCSSD